MGMFDSLYPNKRSDDLNFADEYQTKAYDRLLRQYFLGDEMPGVPFGIKTYQVAVLGGPDNEPAWATVRDGVLTEVGVDRDENLPSLGYYGN